MMGVQEGRGSSECPESMTNGPKSTNGGARPKHKLVIVAPTCFYYQISLFQTLAAHPRIDLTVYFCSEEASRGEDVSKKFKADGNWGVEEELLKGYHYKFLRNYSPWPSYLKSVTGLINVGIWREIMRVKPDTVILMSWMNPTWWLAIFACIVARIPFLYLTDQNVQRDLAGPGWKRWVKRLVLGKLLFRLTSGFLCAGMANRMLYKYYGVPDRKLVPFAFSWGYDELLLIADEIKSSKKQLRSQLGISEHSYVVLYCGRLSLEKNPMCLLQAFESLDRSNKELIIVGDGQLRPAMQDYAVDHNLDNVHFFGFRNRKEIPLFYSIADTLVLPSDQETWGIVVNEAMCFGLPVIVSDSVGAVPDLVRHGYNGFIFPRGDVEALAASINRSMHLPTEERSIMGKRSRETIEDWLGRDLTGSLDQYLDRLLAGKARPAQ